MRELLHWCQGGEETPQQSVFFPVTWYSVYVPGLANLYMHSWKNRWKFKFHCTCTDQLSSTWTAKWTSRGKNEFAANDYTVYASSYIQEGDCQQRMSLQHHIVRTSPSCPWNTVAVMLLLIALYYYSVRWIVISVYSHGVYTWPST